MLNNILSKSQYVGCEFNESMKFFANAQNESLDFYKQYLYSDNCSKSCLIAYSFISYFYSRDPMCFPDGDFKKSFNIKVKLADVC